MRGRFFIAALLLVALPAVGCRTTPVRNVYYAPLVPPASMSDADLLQAFRRAGAETGWLIEPVGPGELEGRLTVHGRHLAVVTIDYDRTRFSIYYKNSENLLYDGVHIHRNYNRWVLNLEQNIRKAISVTAPAGGA
jgi:hypothetical protein